MTTLDLQKKTDKEIQACIEAQRILCDTHPKYKGWHFAPHSGICYDCGKNIYQNYGSRAGYSGESHITGCCHCNCSYCD